MTWKDGNVPSNSTYNNQVISLDLVSTFINAAGGDLTRNEYHELDGKDLVAAATSSSVLHDKLFWRKKDIWGIVSDGTNKIIMNNSADDVDKIDIEHYDLNADISESTNLYTSGNATVNGFVSDYKNWDKNNDLPSWIGKSILNKICDGSNNAKSCQLLIDRYAAFAAATQLTETNNKTLTVGKGGLEEITKTSLWFTDPIKNEYVINYTINTLPTNGTLIKNGEALAVGDTFKQIDIDTGAITYQHDDSATTADSFQFNVADGSGGQTINNVVYTMAIDENAGTNYYVSSTLGNDTNDGFSESTPWQTLEKASNANIQPGDKVMFKRGDTFIGQLKPNYSGASGSPITYTAYGSGTDKPIITGSGGEGGDYQAAIFINNQEYFDFEYP